MDNKDKNIEEKLKEKDSSVSNIINKDLSNEKEFSYYDKNIKKSKYYKELEKEAEEYLKSPTIAETSKGPNLTNIHKPIIKLIIVFIIALLIVNYLSPKTNKYPELTGLWGDENGNYYEIYNNKFEMNAGNSDKPFYVGNITNIIETEKGFIVLVKGTKYSFNTDGPLSYDKEMEIVFKIIEYKNELETIMPASIGETMFDIIKLKHESKLDR